MGGGKGPCENVTALGPGDNAHRAGEEALGRAAVSDLRTFMAAHSPASEGLLVGTTTQTAEGFLQGKLGLNTGAPSQVAESPLGQRRPEGL